MLLEKAHGQQELFDTATDWVRREAEARHLDFHIYTQQIEERQSEYYTFISIPIYIAGLEGYDFAKMLGKLERTWNDQEPRPTKLLFLHPASAPRDKK